MFGAEKIFQISVIGHFETGSYQNRFLIPLSVVFHTTGLKTPQSPAGWLRYVRWRLHPAAGGSVPWVNPYRVGLECSSSASACSMFSTTFTKRGLALGSRARSVVYFSRARAELTVFTMAGSEPIARDYMK